MAASISVLPIEQLHRRADARPVNDDVLAALCESIEQIGLVNPVRVRRNGEGYEVIAGAHRFAACDLLGRRQIECIIVEDDDLHAELAMLDENLMRAELSASERATSTARRKAIYLELHPETAQHVAGAHGSNKVQGNATDNLSAASFAAETAKVTSKDERTVRRDAERGEKVIPEVMDMIRATKLDTGTYLDKLKKMTPNDQVHAAKRDLKAPARTQERQKTTGISRRVAPTLEREEGTRMFEAFVTMADNIVAVPISDLVASAGRERAVLGQRASGLIDHLSEILEALDR